MFKHMRLTENELTREDAEEMLRTQMHGTMAYMTEDGYPCALPLSYVYEDGKIYFHGANDGQKYHALQKNPKVSFSVIAEDNIIPEKFNTLYRSAMVYGTVSLVQTDEEKMDILMKIVAKYSPDHMEGGRKYAESSLADVACYVIDVEHMTAKQGLE